MRHRVKLGIAPYCWLNDDMPELGAHISIEQCVKEMALAGYQGCELANRFPNDPDELLALLKPYGLQVANQWFSAYLTKPGCFNQTLQEFADHCVKLARVGATIVGVSEQTHSIQSKPMALYGDHRHAMSAAEWRLFIDGLHHMGGIAKRLGITLTYHHHMGTSIQTQDELIRLMDNTDPELIHLLFDTGHFAYAGIDPCWVLDVYGHRVAHVHLKDYRKTILDRVKSQGLSFLQAVRLGAFTVPGDGDIDFLPIFERLHSSEYKGWLIVEAEQDPDKAEPLTYAAMGYQYILRLLNQISVVSEVICQE